MKRHVLSVLVRNSSGVLSRVSGLFSRRGYNIDSLSVGKTEDPDVSRMTISLNGDDDILEQFQKQLKKLVEIISVENLKPENAVYRELVLIKVRADAEKRASINEVVKIFRSKIIDISKETLTIELTGDESKISAIINLMQEYGIEELVRTGVTALERGDKTIKNHEEFLGI
ncbi:MAG: acetolactate synthase small subunit [Clostridium sp.]|uniref:acetolactate synthase small subunit n=1 Tax=Clostridium sp. TaxID=1506 RepID=UPI003F3DF0EE